MMFNLIAKAWNFISRLARVIVEIDDMLIEAEAFSRWLRGEEDEEKR